MIFHYMLSTVFQQKNFSFYILLTDQISLPHAFTSQDIVQHVCRNCLLTGLRRHQFQN